MDLKNNKNNLLRGVLITLLITQLFIVFTYAQEVRDIPATSNGQILFFVDHSAFKGKENKTYEEFYLMIPADQIQYKVIDGKRHGAVKIKSTLIDNSGKTINSKEWNTETSLPNDTNSIRGLAVYDQWTPEQITPGTYKVEIGISDQNSPANGTASFDLIVPSFTDKDFTSSQIEFVTRAEETAQPNQFTKGKLSMIPNPSRRFGILNPVLYLYYELYNLPEAANKRLLSATYLIQAIDGKIIKTFPSIQIKRPGESTSVFHGVNVATVPSGIYDLKAEIFDSSNGKSISFTRRFEVMQFSQARPRQPELSEEQAEVGGRIIQYIAPDKYPLYEKLDLTGKAQFLVQFWHQLDPSPGTSENEYLEKIMQRYQYANQNFGWGKVEGWATDRGRILIKYGNPDEVERHEFETDAVPYEIWYYRRDKSYMFVFADLKSNGRYSLLHSTKEGEVNNPYWTEQVKRM